MYEIITAQEAAGKIFDGATIGLNAFLALSSPFAIHDAISEQFQSEKHPCDLTLYGPCGFGCWDENRYADRYTVMGAVKKVITSHFPSIPGIERMAQEEKIISYNLPLGVMAQCVRAAGAGHKGYLTKMGLNIFVDPRLDGPAANQKAKAENEEWVKLVEVAGEEYLFYKTPRFDFALIKGTSVDPTGNISFEDECVTVDALALAQATKSAGGTVIVQVDRVSHTFSRPRSVIVPGILVDYVVVCEEAAHESGLRAMSGDIHVPNSQMDYWMRKIQSGTEGAKKPDNPAHRIIGRRAARELKAGDVVNIGIGIPEMVGKAATENGILRDIVLTVESGGVGGLPAPGKFFGATIGADCITDMAQQFDFYDGGGLDICFMGGLEVDRHGNVNAHRLPKRFVGIGGFGNITLAAKTVVFCMTFTAKGLAVSCGENGSVHIDHEGALPKFKEDILSISFSAKNALMRGQRVLYVTERCVFTLTEKGLKVLEVYDGIDLQKDILSILPFEVEA